MSQFSLEESDFVEAASRIWWLFLVTGIAWLWVALIVLRVDASSVSAIAILFGIVAIAAGVNEFIAMPSSTTGWKIARGILGALFVIAGIVAFFKPGGTFVALASLFAWIVLFKGIFDVTVALVGPKLDLLVARSSWSGSSRSSSLSGPRVTSAAKPSCSLPGSPRSRSSAASRRSSPPSAFAA